MKTIILTAICGISVSCYRAEIETIEPESDSDSESESESENSDFESEIDSEIDDTESVQPDAGIVPSEECAAISEHPGWYVCEQAEGRCSGVFADGAGCYEFCAAAKMWCVGRYQGYAPCSKEPWRPEACAELEGHKSDWCDCASEI